MSRATVPQPWLGSDLPQLVCSGLYAGLLHSGLLYSGLLYSGLLLIFAAAPTLAQTTPRTTPPTTPRTTPPSYPAATPRQSQQSNSRVSAVAEQFVDLIAAGQFERAQALLNPTLKAGWTVDQMRDDWARLQSVTGAYKARTRTQTVDDTLVLVDVTFERAADNLLIIFDDQQQIRGVDFPLQLPRQ